MKITRLKDTVVVENETAIARPYHGHLIPANGTRLLNLSALPREVIEGLPVADAPAEPDPAAEKTAADKTAKEIIADIPSMNDADLQALEQAEEALGKKARKSVLEAIATEQLQRASDARFADELVGKTGEQLLAMLDDYHEGSREHGMIGEALDGINDANDAKQG